MPSTSRSAHSHEHLAKANQIKRDRAVLMPAVGRTSPERAAEFLRDPPEALASMEAGEFVRRVEQYGTVRAARLLASLQISSTRQLRELTARQRNAIANRLAGTAPWLVVTQHGPRT